MRHEFVNINKLTLINNVTKLKPVDFVLVYEDHFDSSPVLTLKAAKGFPIQVNDQFSGDEHAVKNTSLKLLEMLTTQNDRFATQLRCIGEDEY